MLNTTIAALSGLALTLCTLAPVSQPQARTAPPDPQAADYRDLTIAGFHVRIEKALEASDDMLAKRTLAAITFDLELFTERVPQDAADRLRKRTAIWISKGLAPRPGLSGHGCCYHKSKDWIVGAGLGAEREHAVEVCTAADYGLWRCEQPMMLLHELAHSLHDSLDAAGHDEVKAAYERAKASHAYEAVDYVLSSPDQKRRAYALTNEDEYFAEISEAYFGRNDFAPMTRSELRTADPSGLTLVEHIWGATPRKD